jgi:hypothetical protein
MHTDPTRPATKANSRNRRDWRYYGLALAVLCMLAVPVVAQSCTPSPNCMNPKFNLSAYYGGQNITINQCIDTNSPPIPVRGLTPPRRLLTTRHKRNSTSLPAA